MKFRKCFTLIIFPTLVLMIVASTLFSGTTQAGEVPRIGIIYPKTGIYSSLGPLHLDGVMLAIEHHGLVLGQKPKLFIRDHGT